MARIAFPLGFKIVDNAGTANSGQAIDERMVFADVAERTAYVDNFFYEGLLSYTIGDPYHVSGITADAGFYYRTSGGVWSGLNADTIDDKHAFGEMDSSSNTATDPSTGTNIVDHVNYLYTITDALSGSRQWLDSVATFAALATVYPSPTVGDSALVTSENKIYTWNGTTWVLTGSNSPLLSSTVDGIVNKTWYTSLNSFITTPANYLNRPAFSSVRVTQGGALVGIVTAPTVSSELTLNAGSNVTLTTIGSTVHISASGTGGGSITANATELIYNNDSATITGATNLRYDGARLIFGYDASPSSTLLHNSIVIGRDAALVSVDGVSNTSSFGFDWNIAIGNGVAYGLNSTSSVGTYTTGKYNTILGHAAGYDMVPTDERRFIVSSGWYAEVNNVKSDWNEFRLLDGVFPPTNASTDYGSLKIRGTVYFKEEDTYINRVEKTTGAGDWDMVLASSEAGEVFLSDLLTTAATGLSSSLNGLTDNDITVSWGGTLVQDTEIDGPYDVTFSNNNVNFSTGNTGLVSFDTAETPVQYVGDVVFTADRQLVNKKYVDDLITAAGVSHEPVSISATANGLAIGEVSQILSIGLASGTTTGALSSANWTTFNNKQDLIVAGTTDEYYRGDKTWQTLTSDVAVEGVSNLYFTDGRSRNTKLTGLDVSLTGDISQTDSILQAFGKLQYQLDNINVSGGTNIVLANPSNGLTLNTDTLGMTLASSTSVGTLSSTDWNTFNSKEPAVTAGVSTQYYRGDKTWASLTTTNVIEGTNKYFTNVAFDDRLEYWGGLQNGFAPLNSSLKIDPQYLYATVDDIIEVANYAALPGTGAASTIYVTLDDSKQYRWGGTTYVEISPSAVSSVNSLTGIVVLTTTEIPEGDSLYFDEPRVRATLMDTVTADTGDVLSTDSVQVAISKLQNRTSGVNLVSDILEFSTDKYTPYTEEVTSALWIDSTDADRLKYSGDFGATSVKSDSFYIGHAWRMIVDPLLTTRMLLQYDTIGDGSGWTNVTTFDAVI